MPGAGKTAFATSSVEVNGESVPVNNVRPSHENTGQNCLESAVKEDSSLRENEKNDG